jgi:hypothetical protein
VADHSTPIRNATCESILQIDVSVLSVAIADSPNMQRTLCLVLLAALQLSDGKPVEPVRWSPVINAQSGSSISGPYIKRSKSLNNSTSPNNQIETSSPGGLYIEPPILEDKPTRPENKFAVVKYGPFLVKAGEMQDGVWTLNAPRPCDDCYITAMEADLQYMDGRSANIDEGAWLHHIVLHNGLGIWPGTKGDIVCSGTVLSLGLPYPHRIFASGNERRIVRLNEKHKFGILVEKGEQFQLIHDILNQGSKDQTYYIVMVSDGNTSDLAPGLTRNVEIRMGAQSHSRIPTRADALDGSHWMLGQLHAGKRRSLRVQVARLEIYNWWEAPKHKRTHA